MVCRFPHTTSGTVTDLACEPTMLALVVLLSATEGWPCRTAKFHIDGSMDDGRVLQNAITD